MPHVQTWVTHHSRERLEYRATAFLTWLSYRRDMEAPGLVFVRGRLGASAVTVDPRHILSKASLSFAETAAGLEVTIDHRLQAHGQLMAAPLRQLFIDEMADLRAWLEDEQSPTFDRQVQSKRVRNRTILAFSLCMAALIPGFAGMVLLKGTFEALELALGSLVLVSILAAGWRWLPFRVPPIPLQRPGPRVYQFEDSAPNP